MTPTIALESIPPERKAPNRTSLTLGYATEPSCGWDTVPPQDAAAQPSIVVPDSAKQVAAQWQQWIG